jgi:DNA-binding NarL/FixJ family response regulator
MILSHKRDWEVCGEAKNGWEAVRQVMDLAPDIVILDVFMMGKNGFEAAAEIQQVAPRTKIIFFSMHEVPASARVVGGNAFVSKGSSAQELVTTIERVVAEPKKRATSA